MITLSPPSFRPPSSVDGRCKWWVLHTRPRCEKKLDQWLAQQGLGHYLPLRERIRVYPGKRTAFHHPLFAGYTFGAFSLLQRNAVYGSGHVAAVIEVHDQGRLLAELEAIRLVLASGLGTEDCPYLGVGRRARITTGRLKGLEGVVQRRSGRTKLILSVEILQRSVALEIEPDWLEPFS
ncbi:MAG: transcription termination/antitermination NusG family protein [Candidatus Methylacidiphilales bacterium]|nr:transcription termination/antitermination NusG family protein [Candidatus Methylacidiphilales bacterium]